MIWLRALAKSISWPLGFTLSVLATLAQGAIIPVYQINEGEGAYLTSQLTHDIYNYSANPRLNDLVVIDKLGNKLPYKISSSVAPAEDMLDSNSVRFFPVAVGAPPEALLTLSSASIRLDDNNISVSAEKKDNSHIADQITPIDFYVVDISERRKPLQTLLIDWQFSDANQYLEVEVSGTNDMQNWQAIKRSTLVQLQKGEQNLTRNSLPLNLAEKEYAYLRLRFLRGGEQLNITKITAQNRATSVQQLEPDVWALSGELAEEQESALQANKKGSMPVAAWEFERNDIAPLSSLSLKLGSNYSDSLKVFSRRSEKQPWQLVHQGVWFNVQVGNDWQQSDAINAYQNSDSFWRIELNELVRTQFNPALVFSRQPQTLQFIANNNSPYQIAINDSAAPDSESTNAAIFSQLVRGKNITWVPVNYVELKPEIDSFARQVAQVSWKAWLFWSVLLLAVGMLIWVAVGLVRQMKYPDSTRGVS